jgi:hypothetical protein
MGKNKSLSGADLDPNAVAYPCGLVAKSVFTDTFNISTADDPFVLQPIKIDSSNIAWKSDVDYKYKNQPGDYKQI